MATDWSSSPKLPPDPDRWHGDDMRVRRALRRGLRIVRTSLLAAFCFVVLPFLPLVVMLFAPEQSPLLPHRDSLLVPAGIAAGLISGALAYLALRRSGIAVAYVVGTALLSAVPVVVFLMIAFSVCAGGDTSGAC